MKNWAELKVRVRKSLQSLAVDLKSPPQYPAGHYYSPIPSAEDIARAGRHDHWPAGVRMVPAEQLELAQQLELTVPMPGRWTPNNKMFGSADASVLKAMLLHLRPKKFIEIGSGHSTALVLDVAEREIPDLRITCVEPYADRLRSVLRSADRDRLTLVEKPVQDIPSVELASMVGSGDIFFIDSSHVAKAGSDVCHLFLNTLPRLPVGAIVHVHDIFWPFEYPSDWLEHGRAWTEAYLLHAYLAHNSDWKILLFNSWLWKEHPKVAPAEIRHLSPGSIWLERVS